MDDARRKRRNLGILRFLSRRRHQLLRYAGVSVISTLTSLVVLGLLVGVAGVGAVAANLAATAAGTLPSFELNRRWVWSRSDRRSVGRELVPFCALSFAGLLLSTVTVRAASILSAGSGQLLHTGAVELANVGAYGSLWVVQFVLLDRVLFARRRFASDRPLVTCHPAAGVTEHVWPLRLSDGRATRRPAGWLSRAAGWR